MRSTRSDTALAVILALALHALLLAVLLLALPPRSRPVAGAAVHAEWVDERVLSAAQRHALAQPATPEPALVQELEPESIPEPEPVPDPEPILVPESEPVIDPAALEREREAEPQRREHAEHTLHKQIEHEQREEQAKREAEAERQRQREAEAEAERQRQEEIARRRREDEQKLQRLRAERARAEREERDAQQRLRQLQEVRRSPSTQTTPSAPASAAGPPPGTAAGAPNLHERWIAALLAQIERQWIRPDSIRSGMICPIRIRILPGGEVRSAQVQPECPYDEAGRRSVEGAVLKASPLPWAGYEAAAVRDVTVRFQPAAR